MRSKPLSTVRLQSWGRPWQTITLEPESGRCRAHWFWRPSAGHVGWASQVQGAWYCLWNRDGVLVLQHGPSAWHFGEVHVSRNLVEGGRACRFTATVQGATVLDLRYRPVGQRFWNRDDPTFDRFDEELEDFFAMLERLSRDPEGQRGVTQALLPKHSSLPTRASVGPSPSE